MKKHRLLLAVIIVSTNFGCTAQRRTIDNKGPVYKIVNLQLREFSSSKLYYKSLVVKKSTLNNLGGFFKCHLNKANFKLVKEKVDSINKTDLSEGKKEKFKDSLEKKYIALKISDFLSEKDLEKMSDELVDYQIKWNKNLVSEKLIRTKKEDNSVSFSVPVFNSANDISLMFLKFKGSFQAHFYKKENSIWKFYCYYLIGTSD